MTKVGDPIWIFFDHIRMYAPDNRSTPIYRKKWVKLTIDGETNRSWLVGEGVNEVKIPKSGVRRPGGPRWALTVRDVDVACWLHEHRHRIVRKVGLEVQDAKIIEIARLIDYPLPDFLSTSTVAPVDTRSIGGSSQ